MLKKRSQILITLLFLIDLLIVGLCWNAAYYARFYWLNYPIDSLLSNSFSLPLYSIPDYRHYFRATFVVVFFAAICFTYAKMYNPKRISRYRAEFQSILKANVALFIILTGITFYYRRFSYSRVQSVYFLFFNVVSITLFRLAVRSFLSYLRRHGKNLRRILIIGNGRTADNFYQKVSSNKALGFVVVGYIARNTSPVFRELDYLGEYSNLFDSIEEKGVDQVYIALDSNQQSDMEEIDYHLAEQMVDINIVPDIYHTLSINPEILDLDGIPVIALRQSAVEGWSSVLKRTFDIVGATCFIILLLPVWIVVPILIKLTSPGPVFYLQERMGLDGSSFNMIKFRSMRIDAEAKTGAVWAREDDDRKTKLGAFMRKTSLDEVPQFFNVLLGTMSLVGPRPERPVFIKKFKKQIPNYMLRHKMKAGITGWAQVNGWRGNTSLEKRIECDIYYLTHWSVWFDIKILLKTVITGMVNPNAY